MSSPSKVPLITLNNGQKIPQLGYGCPVVDEIEDCMLQALKIGYRHFDAAHLTGYEKEIGLAIRKSGIPRSEIFMTSKLYITEYGEGITLKAIDKMLKRFNFDYMDLILLHFPFNDYIGAYKDLEKAYEQGKVKNIGISNFENKKLEELCNMAKIKPVVNQVELYPYFQQNELRARLEKYNTKIEAYCPLRRGESDLFSEEIFKNLAKKYKKSVAQIILRWHIQRGNIIIPSSINPERIKENFEIFDFEMTPEEIKQIDGLDGKEARMQLDDEELEKDCLNDPPPSDD